MFDCSPALASSTHHHRSTRSARARAAIYVPAWWERDSIILIGVSAMLILLGSIGYFILKKKLKQRFLLAKVRAASSYRAHCPLRLRLHRAFACHSHPL